MKGLRVTSVCRTCSNKFSKIAYPSQFKRGLVASYCSRICLQRHSRSRTPVSIRFWKYVKKTASCWLWTGSKRASGYGQISLTPGKPESAHRVSWEIHKGAIPAGNCVLHSCDNRACVFPNHLRLGTPAENMRDCCLRHRHIFGSRSPNAKLTEAKVKTIRAHPIGPRGYITSLAKQYGVTPSIISEIIHRKRWNHVP